MLDCVVYHVNDILNAGWKLTQLPVEEILTIWPAPCDIELKGEKVTQTTQDDPAAKALQSVKQQDSRSIRFSLQVYVFVYTSQTEGSSLQKIK